MVCQYGVDSTTDRIAGLRKGTFIHLHSSSKAVNFATQLIIKEDKLDEIQRVALLLQYAGLL